MEEEPTAVREGLPEAYQHALVETVVDLDVVTELVRRNLQEGDIQRVLQKLSSGDRDAFISKLSGLLRKTSALLLISRLISDSLLIELLLPRLIELISEFLDAERCSVFLHDPRTGELYTKAAVGLQGEIRFPANLGIAGAVLRSGESLLVPDAYAHPGFNADVDGRTGYRTRDLLCVPLKHTRSSGTVIVGVIQVLNRRTASFTQDDLKLLEALGSHAAAALANALLHEEVKRTRVEESRLLDVTAALAQAVDLRALLAKIVGTASLVLEAERVTLYVQDHHTKELWALAGQSQATAAGAPSHPEIAAAVFASGTTINIPKPELDSRFDSELDHASRARARDILCVPVRGRAGEVVAVAEAINKDGGPFTREDEARLEAFCGQTAVALENAQLFKDLETNLRHLRSLLEASKALASAVDLDSQLDVIVGRARDVMEAESSRIFMYDEASGTLTRRTLGRPAAGAAPTPVAAGIAGQVARERVLVNVADAANDPRYDPQVDGEPGVRLHAVLSAPIFTHRDRLIGVLQVVNKANQGSFTGDDEALLEAFASHAAVALDRARLIEAFVEKQRMEEGLRLAHDIQMNMLPHVFPTRKEFEIFARLRPARSVGGDFYDFLAEEDRLWFVVGDVSGKGVGAALFMAVTKTLFRSGITADDTPAELLSRINRELGRDNEQGLYVTAFVGRLDLATGELAYGNAGHNIPYRLRGDGSPERLTGAHGLPLGILGSHPYATAAARLVSGDGLLLYTDGVTEAFDREGREFSVERLEGLLAEGTALRAGELVERSFAAVEAFANGAPQSDDITLMALRYLA